LCYVSTDLIRVALLKANVVLTRSKDTVIVCVTTVHTLMSGIASLGVRTLVKLIGQRVKGTRKPREQLIAITVVTQIAVCVGNDIEIIKTKGLDSVGSSVWKFLILPSCKERKKYSAGILYCQLK